MARRVSRPKATRRKRSTGEFSETGYTTPKRSFSPKTGQPTRRVTSKPTIRSSAGLALEGIVPLRSIKKSGSLLKKVGRTVNTAKRKTRGK